MLLRPLLFLNNFFHKSEERKRKRLEFAGKLNHIWGSKEFFVMGRGITKVEKYFYHLSFDFTYKYKITVHFEKLAWFMRYVIVNDLVSRMKYVNISTFYVKFKGDDELWNVNDGKVSIEVFNYD